MLKNNTNHSTISRSGSNDNVADAFQNEGILPKIETEASLFLKNYPNYDGKNVIVAVWDTGVDPGALGLQETCDGQPKIIDIVDTTGSGDVDTSTVREVQKDGTLLGLSGRTLTLGKWNNPSGKYHLGLKRGYELFPETLVTRLRKERKEKFFEESQRLAVKQIQIQIENFDQTHSNPNADEKKERQELITQLELLQELNKKYDDPGPIYDCVVFFDGSVWRAVVDTTEVGDLSSLPALANYSLEYKYSTFSELDLLNFSVNIYEEGNILSIVTTCGAHGTHVAGIVGAYFKSQPELNGIAPNCQIVSVKIGDSRLGTMETGTALIRGVIATLKNKCDLVNLSFGEATSSVTEGKIIKELSELVNKHGVIFVSSAGNNGPALSTVGAPGSTTPALIGVGAYFSSDMCSVQYSMRETVPENQYTWSSRGPRTDGSLGVCISAPGGAISPVPNFTLKKSQLMNGTSMASPNACGNLALLLSALKSEGIAYSPYTIRRAIENTAQLIDRIEPFAQGCGLLQIQKSYTFLKKNDLSEFLNVRFEVQFPARGNAGGLYLREWEETQHSIETTVSVNVIFKDDVDNHLQVEFEKRIILVTNVSWVQAPKYLVQYSGERTFLIFVDPTELELGTFHYTEIWGIDSCSPSAGPLFRIPITVIRPIQLEEPTISLNDLSFQPGFIYRKFYLVPEGSMYAELSITGKNIDTNRRFVVHTLQLLPRRNFVHTQYSQFAIIFPNDTLKYRFNVISGTTLELCIAQFWSSIGDTELDVQLEFHGFVVSGSLSLYGESATRIDVRSLLRSETLDPSLSISKIQSLTYPSNVEKKTSKDPRNILPKDRQIYEMILTYNIKQENSGKIVVKVPILHELLYESPYESQFWMVFDTNKQLIAKGDFRPKPFQLAKGSYVIKVQIRHDELPLLDKLKDLSLIIERRLEKEINFDLFSHISGTLVGGFKFTKKELKKGSREVFFIKAISDLPKDAKPGDILLGSLKLFKNSEEKTLKLKGLPFMYAVSSSKPSPASPTTNIHEGTISEQLEESLLQQTVTFLTSLLSPSKMNDFNSLIQTILEQHPKHLPLLQLHLRALDQAPDRTGNLDKIIAAADLILNNIDQSSLAIHFGTRLDSDDPVQNKIRQEMTKKKETLIDALYRKILALSEKNAPLQEIEKHYKLLQQWVEPTDSKFTSLSVKLEQSKKFFGKALSILRKNLETPDKKTMELQIELLEQLQWKHWSNYFKKWLLIQFPSSYQL